MDENVFMIKENNLSKTKTTYYTIKLIILSYI